MVRDMESKPSTPASEQVDLRIVLRCGVCNEKYPRPVQVGEAVVYESGQWTTGRVERYGKGHHGASAESRLAQRGSNLQVYWPDGSAIDANLEALNWATHVELLRDSDDEHRALLGERWIGVYRCPRGHWVGADNMDALLDWLEVAREHRRRAIYLPELTPVVTG